MNNGPIETPLPSDAEIAAAEALGDPSFNELDRRRQAGEAELARQADPEVERNFDQILSQSGTMDAEASSERAARLYLQAKKFGLSQDELEAIRSGFDATSGPEATAYEDAVDAVLTAASRRTTGLQSLFDRKLAQLEGEEADDDDEQVSDATIDTDLGEQPDPGDDPVARLLQQLGGAESYEEQLEMLSSIIGEASQQADPQADARELKLLRREHPQGMQLLDTLAGATTYAEQAAILEEFARTGTPVPEVDRNNPARPVKPGLQTAAAGEMTDTIADALLEAHGKGSLVQGRRR